MTIVFRSSVVGGTTLVRDAINSPNYVSLTSGWTIDSDGSAEFNDVFMRGAISAGNGAVSLSSTGIELFNGVSHNTIDLDFTGLHINWNELNPAGPYSSLNAFIDETTGVPEFNMTPQYPNSISGDVERGFIQALLDFVNINNFRPRWEIVSPTISGGGATAKITLTGENFSTPGVTALAYDATTQTFSGTVTFTGNAQVNGNLTDSNGFKYYRGQRASTTLAVAAAATAAASAVINFPVAFPVGVVPDVHVNTTNTAATQNQWEGHAISVTNTGFQILYHGPAVGAGWNVNAYWNAFYPV